MQKPSLTTARDLWTIVISLFLVGVSWGTLNSKMHTLEVRMNTYESQTLALLEELRRETAEIKLQQTRMANDLEWIKKEFEDYSPSK